MSVVACFAESRTKSVNKWRRAQMLVEDEMASAGFMHLAFAEFAEAVRVPHHTCLM